MTEDRPDDPELRRFERELEFREKHLEQANEMVKQVPGLLSELVTEVVLPIMHQIEQPRRQDENELWVSPNNRREPRRGKPDYSPNPEDNTRKIAEEMRENLDLDTESGGEEA